MFPPSPGFISPGSDFATSADPQHQSVFFGRLPREIRDMIYLAMWDASGPHQHVFEHEYEHEGEGSRRVTTHFPCILAAGEQDSRNDEFEKRWRQQQARRPRTLVQDPVWARRMSSTWHEHWKCEEAMLASRRRGERPGTLFLPSLLTCKRMHDEALPSLYASTTLVLTSLALAHTQLVAAPSPHTRLWQSMQLSLAVPYEQLHRHRCNDLVGRRPPRRHHLVWAELCDALSNLVRFARLRAVVVRLDLADEKDADGHNNHKNNRAWWEVRERWVLSAVRGRLARCLVLQLPELTMDDDAMRPYQFIPPFRDDHGANDSVAYASSSGGQEINTVLATSSSSTKNANYDVADASLPHTSEEPGSGEPSIPFLRLERYPRRRWSREAAGDGVQARLEFFNPREHVVLGCESRLEKLQDLFRRFLTLR